MSDPAPAEKPQPKRRQSIGASTVAITAYNILAVVRAKLTLKQLYERCCTMAHPDLDRELFDEAIAGLKKRNLVTGKVKLGCADSKGRIVKTRNRDDWKITAKGVGGGWTGWMVKDGDRLVPIKEALR